MNIQKVLKQFFQKIKSVRLRGHPRGLRFLLLFVLTIFSRILFDLTFTTLGQQLFPEEIAPLMTVLSGIFFGLSLAFAGVIIYDLLRKPPSVFERHLPEVLRRLLSRFKESIHDFIRGRAVPKKEGFIQKWATKFISKSEFLMDATRKMGFLLVDDLMRIGVPLSPYKLWAESFFLLLISFWITLPVAVYLALFVNSLFLMLLLWPISLLFYPKLKLWFMIADRKRRVSDELSLFAVFASILQSAGLSLYNAMTSLIGKKIFPELEKDALMLKRNVEYFSKSPVQAINDLGRTHPNEDAKLLFLGYSSEWLSGGDTSVYLETKADDFLKEMRFKWTRYSEHSTDIGEGVIATLFVLPALILMSAFIFPSSALILLVAFITIAIPVTTAVIYSIIELSQPKNRNIYSASPHFAGVVGAITFTLAFFLGQPLWSMVAATVAALSAAYSVPVVFQMREISRQEVVLANFLRDLTEYRKMGYDIMKALHNLAELKPYTTEFNNLLTFVSRQIKLGVKLSDIVLPTRSWLVSSTFFIISQLVESGGGSIKCLESLTNFIRDYTRIQKETKSSLKVYRVLSVFTPIGLAFVIAFMFGLISAFAEAMAPAMEMGILGALVAIPPGFLEICYTLVISASISVAILSTKTIDFTLKNLLWLTINLILAILSVALAGYLVDFLITTQFAFA